MGRNDRFLSPSSRIRCAAAGPSFTHAAPQIRRGPDVRVRGPHRPIRCARSAAFRSAADGVGGQCLRGARHARQRGAEYMQENSLDRCTRSAASRSAADGAGDSCAGPRPTPRRSGAPSRSWRRGRIAGNYPRTGEQNLAIKATRRQDSSSALHLNPIKTIYWSFPEGYWRVPSSKRSKQDLRMCREKLATPAAGHTR